MKRFLVVAMLVTAACTCEQKARSTDTQSSSLTTAKSRAAFLCAYALCPTVPSDAAFHVVFHDNSQGFIAGPSDGVTEAVVKIDRDEVERWSRGCTPQQLERRPEWATALFAQRPEWAPTSPPDMYICGVNEVRLIHVKEGIVLWRVEAR